MSGQLRFPARTQGLLPSAPDPVGQQYPVGDRLVPDARRVAMIKPSVYLFTETTRVGGADS
jgi:hypothetical protein